MAETVTVRSAAPSEKDAWFSLWEGYVTFYGAEIPDDVSENTWMRLLDPSEQMFCLVAETDDLGVIGIESYILDLNTWTKAPVCYLEDLFVAETARNLGAGRALIDALGAKARQEKWHRVYWMTDANNETARKLYDKISPVTNWVRYDVSTA